MLQEWLDAVNKLRKALGYPYKDYEGGMTIESLMQEFRLLKLMIPSGAPEIKEPMRSVSGGIGTPPLSWVSGLKTPTLAEPSFPLPRVPTSAPPSPQQTGENLPIVKSVGGWDWQWIPSLEGEGGMWNPLGQSRTSQEELTPYQRAQLGIQQADVMNEARRNELANRANLLARETQRLSMFQAGANTAPYNASRQQLADQFEQMRQLAAGVTSPRNWVQTAYAQAGQGAFTNPFIQEPVDWAEESKSVKGEIQALKTAENNAKSRWEALAKRVSDDIPDNNPSEAELEAAAFRYNEFKARRQGAENVLAERTMEESKGIVDWSKPRPSGATGFETGGRAPAPGSAKSKPFTPAIPGDIQKFLEKPVWGAAVTRPSGQQWAATPWSSREKLFGYLESQGQYPVEMLEQMERELPRNPSLGRRWSPSRSMV